MKIWTRVEPVGEIRVHTDREQEYIASQRIGAWEERDDEGVPEIAAIVYGVIRAGRAEIRVQYEQADYEAHKSNLLVQRAVRQAMKQMEAHIREYFDRS